MSRIIIAGCGYVGVQLARQLVDAGHVVWGVRRHTSNLPAFIRPIGADLADRETLSRTSPAEFDTVVYAASPDDGSDASYAKAFASGLSNMLGLATNRGARRFLFVSSTSVYAQRDGEWVDELSSTAPDHPTALRLLEAERQVAQSALSGVTVRAGGIYGPGRTRLIDRVKEGKESCVRGHFTNRIFRDDLAAIIAHVVELRAPERIYLAVDDEPALHCEVVEWLARRTGAPLPTRTDAATGRKARSNKRCSNARLKKTGLTLRYPTFRHGYEALLSDVA